MVRVHTQDNNQEGTYLPQLGYNAQLDLPNILGGVAWRKAMGANHVAVENGRNPRRLYVIVELLHARKYTVTACEVLE